MKQSVYPHTFSLFFSFFFFLKYNLYKKRNDEKGAEDGGMQKSLPKLFYKEREENGWDIMIIVSGGVWREVPS